MGATPLQLPTKSGLVEGTAVENVYKEFEYSAEKGEHAEVEKVSALGKYKGGSLLGWNLYGIKKSKIILYDNVSEAKGTNYGPVTLNEHESVRDWFGSNGLKFKTALYLSIVEGEVEGVLFTDIE